jgi:hypothetical protein
MEQILRLPGNKAVWRICEPKRDEVRVMQEKYVARILLVLYIHEEWAGQDIWEAWGIHEILLVKW